MLVPPWREKVLVTSVMSNTHAERERERERRVDARANKKEKRVKRMECIPCQDTQ